MSADEQTTPVMHWKITRDPWGNPWFQTECTCSKGQDH